MVSVLFAWFLFCLRGSVLCACFLFCLRGFCFVCVVSFFCLRGFFFICVVSVLFACFLFCLGGFFFVYSVSLVGHRSNAIQRNDLKLNSIHVHKTRFWYPFVGAPFTMSD